MSEIRIISSLKKEPIFLKLRYIKEISIREGDGQHFLSFHNVRNSIDEQIFSFGINNVQEAEKIVDTIRNIQESELINKKQTTTKLKLLINKDKSLKLYKKVEYWERL